MSGPQEDHRRAAQQYRQYAEELSKIAQETTEKNERERLLRMAEAWRQLAARMTELGGET